MQMVAENSARLRSNYAIDATVIDGLCSPHNLCRAPKHCFVARGECIFLRVEGDVWNLTIQTQGLHISSASNHHVQPKRTIFRAYRLLQSPNVVKLIDRYASKCLHVEKFMCRQSLRLIQ